MLAPSDDGVVAHLQSYAAEEVAVRLGEREVRLGSGRVRRRAVRRGPAPCVATTRVRATRRAAAGSSTDCPHCLVACSRSTGPQRSRGNASSQRCPALPPSTSESPTCRGPRSCAAPAAPPPIPCSSASGTETWPTSTASSRGSKATRSSSARCGAGPTRRALVRRHPETARARGDPAWRGAERRASRPARAERSSGCCSSTGPSLDRHKQRLSRTIDHYVDFGNPDAPLRLNGDALRHTLASWRGGRSALCRPSCPARGAASGSGASSESRPTRRTSPGRTS